MTYIDCLLGVLRVLGWIVWLVVSIGAFFWGIWNVDDDPWYGFAFIAFGAVSGIFWVTTLFYTLQLK